jgi:hypothetical protein
MLHAPIAGYTDQFNQATIVIVSYDALFNFKFAPVERTRGHPIVNARNLELWMEKARVFQLRAQTNFLDPAGVRQELQHFLDDFNVLRNADSSFVTGPKVVVVCGIGDVPTSSLTASAPIQLKDTLIAIAMLGVPVIFTGFQEVACAETVRGRYFKLMIDWLLKSRDLLDTRKIRVCDIFTPLDPVDLAEVYCFGRGQTIVESESFINGSILPFVCMLKTFLAEPRPQIV